MRLLRILLLLLVFQACVSTTVEDIDFISGKKVRFYPYASKPGIELIQYVRSKDNGSLSYSASFKIDIQSYHPEKRSFAAKGAILFDAKSGKIKIQLMDRLFGLVFTNIIAGSDGIQIKSAGQEKIHTQPMDDISIQDPVTSRRIVIPFQVIYEFLSRNYFKTILTKTNYYNFDEKRILSRQDGDRLIYLFNEKGLEAIELYSERKNLRAIASVTSNGSGYLPQEITTKVTDMGDLPIEKDLVRIALTGIKTGIRVSESSLRLN